MDDIKIYARFLTMYVAYLKDESEYLYESFDDQSKLKSIINILITKRKKREIAKEMEN
jgi:hypothetical protein